MAAGAGVRPTIVIVSAVHDYRMRRRGSMQAVADAFARRGFRAVFLSVRFSALSLLKGDPRAFLRARANRLERQGAIECYLWRTPLHPFATHSEAGNRLISPLHDVYAAWPNADVDALFSSADVIMMESGLGIVLIPRIRRLNPRATLIYRGSDDLAAIGAHPDLQRRLELSAGDVDHYCLLARAMAPRFAFARSRTFCVPQGITASDYSDVGINPYGGGRHAVCFGPTRFDASFFAPAAAACSDVTFHAIGCGGALQERANVRVYPEMAFRDLLPFVAHADIGIAPYLPSPDAHYLAESSLKLTQFGFLRKPAVCPHFAVGAVRHRFGYAPGDGAQIVAALHAALSDKFDQSELPPPTWDELVPRFLDPSAFPDTAIADAFFDPTTQSSAAAEPFAADLVPRVRRAKV